MSDVVVTDNPSHQRYEAHAAGRLAGVAEYVRTDDVIVFTHVEVHPAFEGKGIGSALARFALDAARADGTRRVVPQCPFVRSWIGKHPDYQDLVGAPR